MLTGARWCLSVVLMFIYLMMNDAEDLFLHLLVSCVFFGKMSIQICCSFFNWIVQGFFAIELYEFLMYFGY